jgi:hypothetical protein
MTAGNTCAIQVGEYRAWKMKGNLADPDLSPFALTLSPS